MTREALERLTLDRVQNLYYGMILARISEDLEQACEKMQKKCKKMQEHLHMSKKSSIFAADLGIVPTETI